MKSIDYEIHIAFVKGTTVGVQARKPNERWGELVHMCPGDSLCLGDKNRMYDHNGKYIVDPKDR